MTTYTELQTLIAQGLVSVLTLNGIIGQLSAQLGNLSLVGDAVQDPIEYEKTIDNKVIYKLKQTTANEAGGTYKGVYRLPASNVCAKIESVDVIAHADPGIGKPASIKAPTSASNPTPSFVDLDEVDDLEGQEFNELMIRSSVPFEVEVSLSECEWCYVWNFALSDELPPGASLANMTYYPGVGYRVTGLNPDNGHYDGYILFPIDVEAWGLTSAGVLFHLEQAASQFCWLFADPGAVNLGSADGAGDHIINTGDLAPYNYLFPYVGSTVDAEGYIQQITMRGNGENPFGENNCEEE